ncbi:hypothetical protein GQ44DRAFT_730286 [Phaeosphaeriaceae sp. PMI808]|nr:hypothetical protein GQ44DRAFT_730286 [Phaeosphaeriaceae sp. PMI808]
MVPPLPRQSHFQRRSVCIASGIRKTYKWNKFRQNTRPRGLQQSNNNCYRNSALQVLLHLPRFVNWIMEHNERGKHWDCRPDDPNMLQPAAGDINYHPGLPTATGCVPCLMKTLIQNYWGVHNLSATGEPMELVSDDPAVLGLEQMARRWFSYPQPNFRNIMRVLDNGLEQRGLPPLAEQAKTSMEIDSRIANQVSQQCVYEYSQFIFAGIEQSIDREDIPHGKRRGEEFDSLFRLGVIIFQTCDGCQERFQNSSNQDTIGLQVIPSPNKAESLETSVLNAMHIDDITESSKNSCQKECERPDPKKPFGYAREQSVRVFPEYVMIYRQLATVYGDKNLHKTEIPDILDLTKYSEFKDNSSPLRYKLVHVINHSGEDAQSGHYCAGVTSGRGMPPRFTAKGVPRRPDGQQFWCDDQDITLQTVTQDVPNKWTVSPIMKDTLQFDPVLIWYERIPEEPRAKPVVQIPACKEEESRKGEASSAQATLKRYGYGLSEPCRTLERRSSQS